MNIDRFFEVSPVIQAHAAVAIFAFIIGAALMVAPKGSLPHRSAGILFVVLMIVVAITAFFIRGLDGENFSIIHVFVPLTLFTAGQVVFFAIRRNRKGHRGAARGLFFGALLIPGLFAFSPGRLMHAVVFGG